LPPRYPLKAKWHEKIKKIVSEKKSLKKEELALEKGQLFF